MATKITSYNPCKNDPYGASSMPIYQVREKGAERRIEVWTASAAPVPYPPVLGLTRPCAAAYMHWSVFV